MPHAFFREIVENLIKKDFLEEVIVHYHYPVQEMDALRRVAVTMHDSILEEAVWNHCILQDKSGRPMTGVIMTLGEGVDFQQDKYLKQGLMTESYMVEVLGSEILLLGYRAYNNWVTANMGCWVERYYFLREELPDEGSTDYTLKELPKLLELLKVPVTCNEAFCMTPRKSVAFYAALTEEKNAVCRGICIECDSTNCPNRIAHMTQKMWNLADMVDRPLPYGYTRIFGK